MGKIRVTGHCFRDNFHCFSFWEINYTYRKIKYSYHLLQKGKEIKKYISTQRTLLAKDLDESEFCRSQQEGSCYEGPQWRKNEEVCENKGRYSGSIDTTRRNYRGMNEIAQVKKRLCRMREVVERRANGHKDGHSMKEATIPDTITHHLTHDHFLLVTPNEQNTNTSRRRSLTDNVLMSFLQQVKGSS